MLLRRALAILAAVLLLPPMSVSSAAQKKAGQGSALKPPSAGTRTGRKKASLRRGRGHRREAAQKAPTRERIREIQTALAREGTYVGEPNGKWDASTVEAMKRFQAANGLNPSGKLDAPSLQKLGLGSKTAGVAAPRTPALPLPATILRPR